MNIHEWLTNINTKIHHTQIHCSGILIFMNKNYIPLSVVLCPHKHTHKKTHMAQKRKKKKKKHHDDDPENLFFFVYKNEQNTNTKKNFNLIMFIIIDLMAAANANI